ncbi:MAG: hypothetical protein ACYDBJ_14755 [Aggregatilineales bacterium]
MSDRPLHTDTPLPDDVRENMDNGNDSMRERVDRLGGEPAPDISPQEFARLQQSGALHIDPQGRVRANRREEADPGVSLRKRRAWYALRNSPSTITWERGLGGEGLWPI